MNDGECAMLVVDAFVAAKVQPPKLDAEYIWGRKLGADEEGLVGDIVQLEKTKFSNGWSYAHHTQVIRKVLGGGNYEVFEQNIGGKKTVAKGEVQVKKLTQGSLVIYRPLPKDKDK